MAAKKTNTGKRKSGSSKSNTKSANGVSVGTMTQSISQEDAESILNGITPVANSVNGKLEPLDEAHLLFDGNGGKSVKGVVLHVCKRDEYIKAWQEMYAADKKKWNDPMFADINPMLNKAPLSTEIDNFCVVAYIPDAASDSGNMESFGKPVGIFSMVVTERNGNKKPIGKQYVVDPEHQGKGIGKAMLLVLEKELRSHGYTWYYIGCSKMSAGILKSFGQEPYSSDEAGDLYKFNVDLTCEGFDDAYHQWVNDAGFAVV
jgi:GNAT superfamily N-acetyltransferase